MNTKNGTILLSTRVTAAWQATDTSWLQAWKTVTAGVSKLARRLQRTTRDADVGRLSDDWLRRFEIEAGKHRNDLW